MEVGKITILDFQGFKHGNNKFVVREVGASYSHKNNEVLMYIVKQPYAFHKLPVEWQVTNTWLYKNHHGLQWTDTHGDKESDVFVKIYENHLKYGNNTFVVKGAEKKEWLLNVIQKGGILESFNVIDLEDLGMPSLSEYKKHQQYEDIMNLCGIHTKNKTACAVAHVYFMKLFILENFLK